MSWEPEYAADNCRACENTALLFARALALTLHGGEGRVVDVVGGINMGTTRRVVVYWRDEQVRVIPFDDRPDVKRGDFVDVLHFNPN